MKKKQTKLVRRWVLLVLCIAIIFLFGNFTLRAMNRLIKPHVQAIASGEVRNAAGQIVKKSIAALELDTNNLIHIIRDSQGNVQNVDYNTTRLNQLLVNALDAAKLSLNAAVQGEKDPYTDIIYYDEGIIYSLPLGMLTGQALLANIGPSIDIRMKTVSSLTGQIKASSSAYGLNNTLLEIDIVMQVEMLVVSPFLLQSQVVEVVIPLVIQLIQGQVPQLMTSKIIG